MTQTLSIALLPGDGIGPEVMDAAMRVLSAVCDRHGIAVTAHSYPFGGTGIDETGVPLPEETLAGCKAADAILLGAVGGPSYDKAARDHGAPRPEEGLLALRKSLGLFANLRPSRLFAGLEDASPLRPEHVAGTDFLIVRELTGGAYFGEKVEGTEHASDLTPYSRPEVERVAHIAFGAARQRRRRIASIDKANVLASSRLWRAVVDDVAGDYPDVTVDHVLVDAMAMHLVTRPRDFDVILTENLFGDILSDEASAVMGSIGLAASASLGAPGSPGLFEPIHGSAPDIAGQGVANPAGMMLSTAQLLRLSDTSVAAAEDLEAAVAEALAAGCRTRDLGGDLGTGAFTDEVLARLA